ncbi:hypothetical protein ACWGJ9_08245 [Curtobacterium citreum]
MTDDALQALAARMAADKTLPVDLTGPVVAALHTVAAPPPGSDAERYGLESAAHIISGTWPTTSALGRDALAYMQARRRTSS